MYKSFKKYLSGKDVYIETNHIVSISKLKLVKYKRNTVIDPKDPNMKPDNNFVPANWDVQTHEGDEVVFGVHLTTSNPSMVVAAEFKTAKEAEEMVDDITGGEVL